MSSHFFKNTIQYIFMLLFLAPIGALVLFPQEAIEIDKELFTESMLNTLILALCVCALTGVIGFSMALVNTFYNYPLKKVVHVLLMLPLAFPAYVVAFLYLASLGAGSDLSEYIDFNLQGELWFLVFVLVVALCPYTYFFSYIGFKSVSQSEFESEMVFRSGPWAFAKCVVFPKVLPYLVSAQVLVLFETLADFGASSMVNVPVMTTLIYKTWFDLFSFSGAVYLSLRYLIVIFLVLVFEYFMHKKMDSVGENQTEPLRGVDLSFVQRGVFLTFVLGFVFLTCVFPVSQILSWSLEETSLSHFVSVLKSAGLTAFVGLVVCSVTASLAVVLSLLNRSSGGGGHAALLKSVSSVGYGVPGTILAVAVYSLLAIVFGQVGYYALVVGLILALSLKFFTVALRPIGESVDCLPQELDEVGLIHNVGWMRRMRVYIAPYLKDSIIVGSFLVMLETMKEMPLTLMLAPSGFQTLSIKIFNLTSEGEWAMAALPSLFLVVIGMLSVTMVLLRKGA